MNTKNKDEIAEAYSSEPWWYDIRGFFILTFSYNSTITQQLRFFGENFGDRHLEVACGTGTLLELIMRWRRWHGKAKTSIDAIDYAPSMLAGAQKRFAKDPEVHVQHADAANLPYEDNHFDTANIANSIHCFPSVDEALKDIARVLKPGGTLAANVLLYPRGFAPLRLLAERINNWGMKKGILYKPFEEAEALEKITAAGYEVVKQFRTGNTLNVIARKPL